ncbi:hypothetical protein CALCODRAFT_135147 [Calocera cornea HHB12733]|uniref:Uncharacterized protein n=1 Tax=Calocera cornea HHB12733 TaxID=1353952 RepID=A0A165CV39_9BASI|nr:hypothetical protein CALCODRAFT_135147 [Calocera cornea HHB12733]
MLFIPLQHAATGGTMSGMGSALYRVTPACPSRLLQTLRLTELPGLVALRVRLLLVGEALRLQRRVAGEVTEALLQLALRVCERGVPGRGVDVCSAGARAHPGAGARAGHTRTSAGCGAAVPAGSGIAVAIVVSCTGAGTSGRTGRAGHVRVMVVVVVLGGANSTGASTRHGSITTHMMMCSGGSGSGTSAVAVSGAVAVPSPGSRSGTSASAVPGFGVPVRVDIWVDRVLQLATETSAVASTSGGVLGPLLASGGCRSGWVLIALVLEKADPAACECGVTADMMLVGASASSARVFIALVLENADSAACEGCVTPGMVVGASHTGAGSTGAVAAVGSSGVSVAAVHVRGSASGGVYIGIKSVLDLAHDTGAVARGGGSSGSICGTVHDVCFVECGWFGWLCA